MSGKTEKVKALGISIVFLIIAFISGACRLSPMTAADEESAGAGTFIDAAVPESALAAAMPGAGSVFSYRYGLKSALSISDASLYTYQYVPWKAKYVTTDGAGGYQRVKRDAASFGDTVSEGIAYGMLISLYFDDMDTFRDLYDYALLHLVDPGQGQYLMHWKVNCVGTDVSEFKLPVTNDGNDHKYTYLLKDYYGHGNWNLDRDEERVYETSPTAINDPNFLKACQYERTKSSATDADLDMAAALVLASYRTNDDRTAYYRDEAARMIKAIIKYDCMYNSEYNIWFIKNGTDWGGWGYQDANKKKPYSWNPSYFAPAWFKLFAKFIDDNKNVDSVKAILTDASDPNPISSPAAAKTILTRLTDDIYREFDKLYSGNRGILPPDWCFSGPGSASLDRATESDRYYYYDDVDANGNPGPDGEIDLKDEDADGKPEKERKKKMSYNFYYDAIRVSWRLAVDYSWFGDARAFNILEKMRNFFNAEGANLVDGYFINANSPSNKAWKREYRDGFNNFIPGKDPGQDGGQWKNSTSFVAMCATSFMINDQTKADAWGARVLDTNDYGNEKFNYYGNSLRMLSLLYVSGRFTSPVAKVALKSDMNQRYVSADSAKGRSLPLYATRTSVTNSCMFDIVAGPGGTVKLRSYANNLYVGPTGANSRTPLTPNVNNGSGAMPLVLVSDSGKTAFRWDTMGSSWYVCADKNVSPDGPLCTTRTAIGQWERFTILPY